MEELLNIGKVRELQFTVRKRRNRKVMLVLVQLRDIYRRQELRGKRGRGKC